MSTSYYADKTVFSTGGVLINIESKKVLLIYKPVSGEWLLPKGHLEDGETIEQAAEREIFEETGYSNKVSRLLSTQVRSDVVDPSKNKVIFWFYSTLSSKEKHEDTQMKNENFKGEWFSEEEALRKLKWEDDKKLITLALKLLD